MAVILSRFHRLDEVDQLASRKFPHNWRVLKALKAGNRDVSIARRRGRHHSGADLSSRKNSVFKNASSVQVVAV
jgi:hypothetical protein